MFTVSFETTNDAFSDDPGEEMGRILERIAGQVRDGKTSGLAIDYNGNTVGKWFVSAS